MDSCCGAWLAEIIRCLGLRITNGRRTPPLTTLPEIARHTLDGAGVGALTLVLDLRGARIGGVALDASTGCVVVAFAARALGDVRDAVRSAEIARDAIAEARASWRAAFGAHHDRRLRCARLVLHGALTDAGNDRPFDVVADVVEEGESVQLCARGAAEEASHQLSLSRSVLKAATALLTPQWPVADSGNLYGSRCRELVLWHAPSDEPPSEHAPPEPRLLLASTEHRAVAVRDDCPETTRPHGTETRTAGLLLPGTTAAKRPRGSGAGGLLEGEGTQQRAKRLFSAVADATVSVSLGGVDAAQQRAAVKRSRIADSRIAEHQPSTGPPLRDISWACSSTSSSSLSSSSSSGRKRALDFSSDPLAGYGQHAHAARATASPLKRR